MTLCACVRPAFYAFFHVIPSLQFYHLCPSYFPHSYRVCLLTYTGNVPGLNPGRVTTCYECVYGAKRVIWCMANGSGQASTLRCELCGSHFSIESAVSWVVTPCIFIAGINFWRSLLILFVRKLDTYLHGLLSRNTITLQNCTLSKNRCDIKQATVSTNCCTCL
jgi:hypothetical protein